MSDSPTPATPPTEIPSSRRGGYGAGVFEQSVPCVSCGYDLRGLPVDGKCPRCEATPPRPNLDSDDVPCLQCGYNLNGLPTEGQCPECGVAIERSLHGNLFLYSSPAYLKSLHRGVFLILISIIVQFLSVVVGVLMSIGLLVGTVSTPFSALVRQGFDLAMVTFSFVSMFGWWLLSSPDPAFVGRDDGSTSRRIVRIATVVAAVLALIELIAPALVNLTAVSVPALGLGFSLVDSLLWIVSFFAAMCYLRWLAPRLPSLKIFSQAKLLMWLVPVLCTVGAIVVLLGPLVAIRMYWSLLDWVRKDLKGIRKRQAELSDMDRLLEASCSG